MNAEVKRLCDEIKSKYSLTEYVESKGIEINRAGFISCIFHKEKTPSCQINKGKDHEWFYCHGCHASGTILDFYAQMEGTTVGKAIHALSKGIDFSFGLEDIQKELNKEEEVELEEVLANMNTMISIHMFRYLRKVRDNCPKEVMDSEFKKIDKMFEKFDRVLREGDEGRVSSLYKKICIDDFLVERYKELEKKDGTDD
jgi:DNA primase